MKIAPMIFFVLGISFAIIGWWSEKMNPEDDVAFVGPYVAALWMLLLAAVVNEWEYQ